MTEIDLEELLKKLVAVEKLEEINTGTIHLYRLKGQGRLWFSRDQIQTALKALKE